MLAFLKRIGRASLVAALLIVSCWPAFAVEITVLSTPQEGAPGSFVTHVFAVANDGPDADEYALSFSVPQGWGVLGAPASVAVAAAEEETLFVTVTIPADAPAGEYEVLLTAAPQSAPALSASAVATVGVAQTNEIELISPTGGAAAPGEAVQYEFILVNRGNAQDSFSIDASSERLIVALSAASVHLAPQERIAVRVGLYVPADASPGRDALTVTVASTLYEGVGAEAVVFTGILPPGPEGVGTALMEVLPARVRLSLDKDVLGGDFSSRLTLSASGQIAGGYFASNVSFSDPLGADAPELGSFSILYRKAPVAYAVGDGSQRLSDLVQLSCRGGSITVDEDLFDLAVIAGGYEGETRFAGRLALGPEEANLGIGYLGIRDPEPTFKSVWSATASAEPLEDWKIRCEGALGIDGVLSSRAFLFGTEIDASGFFFSGTAFSVGTDFPGSRSDSAGIEVSHRLRMTALSLSASLSHVWDNVIGNPLTETLIEDELGFNLTTTPLEDGPTLDTTVQLAWDRYANLSLKSETDTLLAAGISETSGVFPYEVSGKVTDRIDHVLGSHVRRSTFSEGAGLSVDSFYLYLELTQEKEVDLIADVVLSTSSEATLRFRPEGTLHEASIAFGNTIDAFDLSASLYIRFVEGLDVVFDGSVSWDRADASAPSFGWGIALNADIDIPVPFFVTKGQIEGRAFVDRNGDGAFDVGDSPARGIVIGADRKEASTDADGLFRFSPSYPGPYAVTAHELPPGLVAGRAIEIELRAGQTAWVNVPLMPVVLVTGRLFDDRDQDGMEGTDESGFGQVRFLLTDARGSVRDAYTDTEGTFDFPDVAPGRYDVSVDASTLPVRFLFTTADNATLEVTAEAPPPLLLGGTVRPPEVVVTFQPPTADFIYTPELPVTGEPVAFDATPSFDFDGEVAGYAWDFDADGLTDATGPAAEHAFPEEGVHDVSLTVVDDTGSTDTIVVPIEVRARPDGSQPGGAPAFQPPIADFSFAPAAPTADVAVRFDGSLSTDFDGAIVSYAWDFDGDGRPDAFGPVAEHAFAGSGLFPVSLTVTDDAGNTDVLEISIDIGGGPSEAGPAPGPPIANFTRSPAEPTAGEPVLFNGTPSLDPGGRIAAFSWDFDGDGRPDSDAPLAQHAFADGGQYAVTLTVTDNDGNTDAITMLIVVAARPPAEDAPSSFQPPIADFAYMPAAPSAGDPVLFNGTFSSDFDGYVASYAWDFDADGTVDSTDSVAEHTFASPGTYEVSLTVIDNGGNRDTIAVLIDVE